MPYPNPYDFVPLENAEPLRVQWSPDTHSVSHYRKDRYSGRIDCILHPETPIFVHGQGQQNLRKRGFHRINGRPGIPASSLKGAIRSIYEIVTDGCLSSLSDSYRGPKRPIKPTEHIPPAYWPCHDLNVVCPGCLLFGMVEQDLPAGQQARGLAGRLTFSDATPVRINYEWRNMPAPGGGPQPRHESFYFDNASDQILGRKLYFHHRDYQETIRLYGDGGRPGLMQVELHKGDFAFTIDFVNLTEKELNFLCYSLLLEDDIRHHLGYGKSYGLGSARIRIQSISLVCGPGEDASAYFRQLTPAPPSTVDAQDFAAKGRAQWLARTGTSVVYNKFKQILAWPGRDLYQYPTYQWFRRTPGTGTVTLAEYQAGVRRPSSSAQKTTGASPTGKRQQGRVTMFNDQRGFGFIQTDGGESIFVHFSKIRRGGPRRLQVGQRVEFEVHLTSRGPQAWDVVVLQGGESNG
ncbi:MAG: hypothetical protein D6704_02660 [Nitrospirae bacterium]|nr:MAG: hypothetical protein D6704_02660 [Nitrospirota bacterium]